MLWYNHITCMSFNSLFVGISVWDWDYFEVLWVRYINLLWMYKLVKFALSHFLLRKYRSMSIRIVARVLVCPFLTEWLALMVSHNVCDPSWNIFSWIGHIILCSLLVNSFKLYTYLIGYTLFLFLLAVT